MRALLLLRLACPGACLGACLLAACAPAPVAPPAEPAAPEQLSCAPARDADFDGAGEQQLRRYVAWLAEVHGKPVGLQPRTVALGIVRGAAKPGPAGVQAAEIACGDGDYRITLYRDALAGRPLALAYKTVAHEFFHLVQIRRDHLDCAASKGHREAYEREADAFAMRVVPACRRR
jgi:hypothetical protein